MNDNNQYAANFAECVNEFGPNAHKIAKLADQLEAVDPDNPMIVRARTMVATGMGWSFADSAINDLEEEIELYDYDVDWWPNYVLTNHSVSDHELEDPRFDAWENDEEWAELYGYVGSDD